MLLKQYCIVYRYLYSASHSISQTEVLSVHFISRKKVRLKARERDKERGAERTDERRGGRQFQSDIPIDGKDLVRATVVLTRRRKLAWRVGRERKQR